MGEWKEYKIKDLGVAITGKTPSSNFPEEFGSDMPFITPTDYKYYGKWADYSDRGLSQKGIEKLQNKVLPPNSVLVTCIGSDMGKVVLNKVPVITNQQINSVIPNQELVAPVFLYYKIVDSYETLRMYSQAGTAVPILNKGDFEEINLTIPSDLSEQKSIASILSGLDDKIDLLHRQNITLEALAETLFRQWFVEDAEEGEEITLSNIADHVKLSINPIKQPTTLFEHYSIPAFDEGQEPKRELGSEIRSNKYRVLPNTILVSKLNPRIPRIWSVYGEINEDSSICSTEFQVVKPRQSDYFGFIYCYLKSWNVMQELANAVGGTSGSHQRVNPEDIFNLMLRRPPLDKFKKFDRMTNDYWEKISRNRKHIRTLTRLRDTLLPKLMSGEVRVKD